MRVIALGLCALPFVVGHPTDASACSCKENGSPQEELARATAVFVGTPIASTMTGSDELITFEVTRVWKGRPDPRITVRTGATGGKCGLILEDEPFLIYAYGPPGALSTSSCTRSVPASHAESEMGALGAGTTVSEGGGPPTATGNDAALRADAPREAVAHHAGRIEPRRAGCGACSVRTDVAQSHGAAIAVLALVCARQRRRLRPARA